MSQFRKSRVAVGKAAQFRLAGVRATLILLLAAGLLAQRSAYAQGDDSPGADSQGVKIPSPKRPPEQEIIFEGQGSFGNYKIFASGEDSKLFTSGVEYDRHSWGRFLNANVYYVAEFLPFVLLDEPADVTFYGSVIPLATQKKLVPGIGITPIGFRLLWRDGKAIKPYLMAKGGLLLFTQKAESPWASYVNISLQSDLGVQIRMTPRVDFRMGLGDYHFSDGFVVPSNPGLDVMSWSGGISYHLRK